MASSIVGGANVVVSGRRKAEGQPGLIVDQTAESYAATFDTNVLGTLLSLKHELRVMTAQKSGSIINISSTYGHEGSAYASVYAASKHAVEGFTKSAALEAAASGVRVNAVAPGPTDTGMLDRLTGTPENKAALVTGGSRGIGLAAALALAKSGAQVLVHYSRGERDAISP
jgi:NAD(P)-dependent dehydrogenase (short-subunit alcohol dehydrogenase family)